METRISTPFQKDKVMSKDNDSSSLNIYISSVKEKLLPFLGKFICSKIHKRFTKTLLFNPLATINL